jgi:histidinol-phosphate aminotransferase
MQGDFGTRPRVHGGVTPDELDALGLDPNDVIDFSSSVNPYGPCPEVVAAIRNARVDRYPDATASALRRAIASASDTSPDRIVVGNGAADLLWTLARVLIRPGTPVLVAEPTFAEFRAAATFAGARILEHRATATSRFQVDLEAVEQLMRSGEVRVVYLCSPGTPTGSHVPVEQFSGLAQRHSNVTFVLDQAFLSLSEHAVEENEAVPANVVRVRSLTKDHAIAGIRLGYVLATRELAERLEAARPPWSTSSIAQAAGLTALAAGAFVEESRRKLLTDRDELVTALTNLGLEPLPSCACFFAFPTKGVPSLRARLLRQGLIVRDCASFGMPGYIRLAARPRADRERLVSALREEVPC